MGLDVRSRQLRLNLVAAVAGSQNPRNAHVLEHLFERWRAFQLDVSTADDVTRAAELRFLAHHPAECAAAALALAVIHRAWSRTRSRVRALKAELSRRAWISPTSTIRWRRRRI